MELNRRGSWFNLSWTQCALGLNCCLTMQSKYSLFLLDSIYFSASTEMMFMELLSQSVWKKNHLLKKCPNEKNFWISVPHFSIYQIQLQKILGRGLTNPGIELMRFCVSLYFPVTEDQNLIYFLWIIWSAPTNKLLFWMSIVNFIFKSWNYTAKKFSAP